MTPKTDKSGPWAMGHPKEGEYDQFLKEGLGFSVEERDVVLDALAFEHAGVEGSPEDIPEENRPTPENLERSKELDAFRDEIGRDEK